MSSVCMYIFTSSVCGCEFISTRSHRAQHTHTEIMLNLKLCFKSHLDKSVISFCSNINLHSI